MRWSTGRTWASAALRPPAGDIVLLADPSLIREPDFYRVAVDRFLRAHRQALSIIELGELARRFSVPEPVGTMRVEPDHPVLDDLKADPADLRRLGAHCTVIDGRKSQRYKALVQPPLGYGIRTRWFPSLVKRL